MQQRELLFAVSSDMIFVHQWLKQFLNLMSLSPTTDETAVVWKAEAMRAISIHVLRYASTGLGEALN